MKYRNKAIKFGAGASALAASALTPVYAALDTTAVQTAITSATVTGETVGGYVIGSVAALVVIGLVIGIIKKL